MQPSDVTFKTVDTGVETPMDVVEIKYPDGKVVAFPVDEKSPETGIPYRDMWSSKYQAFKAGNPDSDRVAQLNSEIEQRQAELKAMSANKRGPDDERVQENLGYGKVPVGGVEQHAGVHARDKPPKRARDE